MKIVVPVKRVVDYNVKVRAKRATQWPTVGPRSRGKSTAAWKQLEPLKPEDLGVDVKPRIRTLKVTERRSARRA